MMKNYPSDWFIEIKATRKNSISRSAVKPHQLKALRAVRSKQGFHLKLTDAGRVRNPFDSFGVHNKDSFVMAYFYKQKICLAIHPDKWCGAKADSECEFSFRV